MRIEDPIPALPQTQLPLLAVADLQDSLMVASNDLDRLQRLLTDATETLMGHFCGASAEIGGLAGLTCKADGPVDGSASSTLRPGGTADAHLRRMRQHLAGAVTALQFQDMASQLISHTRRRLRNCTDQLARDVMGDDDEDGAAVVQDAPMRPNPVTQDEMDAGSVELF